MGYTFSLSYPSLQTVIYSRWVFSSKKYILYVQLLVNVYVYTVYRMQQRVVPQKNKLKKRNKRKSVWEAMSLKRVSIFCFVYFNSRSAFEIILHCKNKTLDVKNTDLLRSNKIQEEKINRKIYQYTYINKIQNKPPQHNNTIRKRNFKQ